METSAPLARSASSKWGTEFSSPYNGDHNNDELEALREQRRLTQEQLDSVESDLSRLVDHDEDTASRRQDADEQKAILQRRLLQLDAQLDTREASTATTWGDIADLNRLLHRERQRTRTLENRLDGIQQSLQALEPLVQAQRDSVSASGAQELADAVAPRRPATRVRRDFGAGAGS